MALEFADRIVQWAVYQQINPFIDARFIEHSYGCRNGKGTLAAAQQLLAWIQLISRKPDAGEWRIVKIDVSKFFYRVDHETALEIYRDFIDDEWFDWLIGSIINDEQMPFGLPRGRSADDCPREARLYDVGIPIGNLTSQETANIYLDRLDQFCKHALRLRYYIRYMDDVVILVRGSDEAERCHAEIEVFLRERLKLDMNRKTATYRINDQIEFVGAIITPYGMRLRKKTVRHAKRSMKHVAEMYAIGTIDLDTALATIRCYIGLTRHKNGHSLCRWIEDNIVLRRNDAARIRAEREVCERIA
jgi:retron-type reverse transcriptase